MNVANLGVRTDTLDRAEAFEGQVPKDKKGQNLNTTYSNMRYSTSN